MRTECAQNAHRMRTECAQNAHKIFQPASADVYCEAQVVTIPKWQGWAIAAKSKLEELTAV